MIALQRDGTLVELREVRHLAELALRDAAVEILAAQNVFEILHAVDDVLALVGSDHEADVIPLADGLGGVERPAGFRIVRRLIERVEPAAVDRVYRCTGSNW